MPGLNRFKINLKLRFLSEAKQTDIVGTVKVASPKLKIRVRIPPEQPFSVSVYFIARWSNGRTLGLN